jgi:hypothetical protein
MPTSGGYEGTLLKPSMSIPWSEFLIRSRERCRILRDGRSGGAVCRRFDDLDAVLESDTSDDFGQLICSIQAPPGF